MKANGSHDLDLQALRHSVTTELLNAARNNLSTDAIEPALRLLDAIDQRIEQRAERPSLERRQLVADRGATPKTGGHYTGPKRNAGTAVP